MLYVICYFLNDYDFINDHFSNFNNLNNIHNSE